MKQHGIFFVIFFLILIYLTCGVSSILHMRVEENLVRGKELYTQEKCVMCHMIDGVGGKIGPDLSDYGNSGKTEEWLIKFLKDPKSVNPKVRMPAVKSTYEELKSLADYLLSLKKR